MIEEQDHSFLDKALEIPIVEAPQEKPEQTPTAIDPLSRITVSSSPIVLEQIQQALEMTPTIRRTPQRPISSSPFVNFEEIAKSILNSESFTFIHLPSSVPDLAGH